MKGYGRIWKDIFWDLGYDWDHILKKISNQDILKDPDISHDILEYIPARYPNSYPSDLSLNILIYPKEISTTISLAISTNDIQMISYYILIYPILISLWDIFHAILFIYPIISLLSLFYILLNILDDIQFWYPLHIQTYPCGVSIQDILLIYSLNYPIISLVYILLLPFFFGTFLWCASFFGLPCLANILWYPLISFHPAEEKKCINPVSNTVPCAY